MRSARPVAANPLFRRVLFCLIAVPLAVAHAEGPTTVIPQQLVDLLATPVKPSVTIAGLPDSYAAWTDAQRSTVPSQMQGRCRALWTMMNDSGRVKLLPAEQPAADTPRLVMDLCLAAHMPLDWPGRTQDVADAESILQRSTALGQPLKLPRSLQNGPEKRP